MQSELLTAVDYANLDVLLDYERDEILDWQRQLIVNLDYRDSKQLRYLLDMGGCGYAVGAAFDPNNEHPNSRQRRHINRVRRFGDRAVTLA
jgi:hypothetical protein